MNTETQKSTHTNFHKEVKKPDGFQVTMEAVTKNQAKANRMIWMILGAIALIGGIVALVQSQSHKKELLAASDLFQAEKALNAELKDLAVKLVPAGVAVDEENADDQEDSAKTAKKDAKKGAKVPPPKPKAPAGVEAIAFKKFDVDTELKKSIEGLKKVAETHRSTRAGFQASLAVGDIYLEHASAETAAVWYAKAAETAPSNLDKALALSNLGYAYDNAGKNKEAIDAFEKSVSLNQETVKGDSLLELIRLYKSTEQLDKRKTTIDRVAVELPNTEYAREAEGLRNE